MAKFEILAPVGGKESLLAAVRSGADAVYFGSEEFNARRNAENFSHQDLKEAIRYCRLNGVKSYLTLNTLIKDKEINMALDLVARVWNYGIDGIIVQDIGIAKLIHKNFPSLPLHASTQLSVHSPAALFELKKMGFVRVVVAREMSKKELENFLKVAKELNIEVEVFVHGALCMCLSGQCYFSAFLGGRSANRGLCAGTCRLPFSATKGTGYDLSLKDLSLIPHLKELSNMGVKSFKIEGRMKRPEYVAQAVNVARQMLDNGKVDALSSANLEKIFSRDGFTDGYYKENLGTHMFGVRTEQDKKISNESMAPIHELYRRERQRIPVKMHLKLAKEMPLELSLDCLGVTVTVTGGVAEKAKNLSLSPEFAKQSLSKLGGTCYFAEEITTNIEDGITIPSSKLNEIRKSAISKLDELRLSLNRNTVDSLSIEKPLDYYSGKTDGIFVRFKTLDQFSACEDLLSHLKGFSLPLNELKNALNSEKLIPKEKESLLGASVEIPRGAFDDDYIRASSEKIKNHGIKSAVCSNQSAVSLAKEMKMEILGGFGLNLFNSFSLITAKEQGLKSVVLSTELSKNEIKDLSFPKDLEVMLFSYGRQPLMLTRNCPVKNGVGCKGKEKYCTITDRKKEKFPVICDNGLTEILNCKITNISDELNGLKVQTSYLYFTLESPEETRQVINQFLKGNVTCGSNFTHGLLKTGVL